MTKIIGISGKARHGKDTVGELLKHNVPGVETLALADPIKRICQKIFDFSDEQLWGALKEVPDKRYPMPNGDGFLTPRWAMQYLGTEMGRVLYSNVWIDYGLRKAEDLLSGNAVKLSPDVFVSPQSAAGRPRELTTVVFTDVRFPNEAKMIRSKGGVVWKVVRPSLENGLSDQSQAHASETAQDSTEMHNLLSTTIVNDGTLDELLERVRASL